jgi:hypothetical protein
MIFSSDNACVYDVLPAHYGLTGVLLSALQNSDHDTFLKGQLAVG